MFERMCLKGGKFRELTFLKDTGYEYHPLRLPLLEIVLERPDARVYYLGPAGGYPELEGPLGDVPHGEEGEECLVRKRFCVV